MSMHAWSYTSAPVSLCMPGNQLSCLGSWSSQMLLDSPDEPSRVREDLGGPEQHSRSAHMDRHAHELPTGTSLELGPLGNFLLARYEFLHCNVVAPYSLFRQWQRQQKTSILPYMVFKLRTVLIRFKVSREMTGDQ